MLLIAALCFEISFGSLASAATNPTQGNSPEPDPAAVELADKIEKGQPTGLLPRDIAHLKGQFGLVFNGKPTPEERIDLSKPSVYRPNLTFTEIHAFIGEQGQLIVETRAGAGGKTGGQTVVVGQLHVTGLPKLLSLAISNEFLSAVDENGQIWTADMGFIAEQFLKAPVPFAKTGTLSPGSTALLSIAKPKLKSRFMTVGTLPLSPSDVVEDAVMPMENGRPQFYARDLLITADVGDRTRVLGVYDRNRIRARYTALIELLKTCVMVGKKDSEYAEQIGDQLHAAETASEAYFRALGSLEQDQAEDPAIKEAINSFTPEILKYMTTRQEHIVKSGQRRRDSWSFDNWAERNKLVINNARRANPALSDLEIYKKAEADYLKYAVPHDVEVYDSEDMYRTKPSFYYKSLAVIAATTVGMLGLGWAAEHQIMAEQIGALHWIYENIIPEPLKANWDFRWKDVASTITINVMAPAIVGASLVSGKIASAINRYAQRWNTAFGARVRDASKYWADQFAYQRLLSFGIRAFSITVAAINLTIRKVADQQTFYAAVDNRVNPFSVISERDEIGQSAGARKTMTLGFNVPFFSDPEDIKAKLTAIDIKKHEADQLKGDAWLLGAVGVAARRNIDLSTLLLMERGGTPSLQALEALYKDENARRDWELATADIYRELKGLANRLGHGELQKLSYDEIETQYRLAETTALKIEQLSGARKHLKYLRNKASRAFVDSTVKFLNWGVEQRKIWSKATPSPLICGQSERQMAPDWLMCNYLPAFWPGEESRTNLTKPENLTFTDSFPYVGAGHWADMGQTSIVYFIIDSSRQVLLWQTKRAKDDEVKPLEYVIHDVDLTRESFLKSLRGWLVTSAIPTRSDVGGYMVARQLNEIGIFVGYMIWTILMRLTLGEQSFHDAAFAFAFFWIAGYVQFAWPWAFIGQGLKALMEFFSGRNERLQSAITSIIWGVNEAQPERRQALLDEGVTKLRGLYSKYRPELLGQLDSYLASQEYRQLVEKVKQQPPFAKEPSLGLTESLPWAGAVITTILAIPLLVGTYAASKLNLFTIAEWAAITTSFFTIVHYTFSKEAWLKYDYLGKMETVLDKVAADKIFGNGYFDKVRELFGVGECENMLIDPTLTDGAAFQPRYSPNFHDPLAPANE